jgi:hypothetical protein
LEDFTSHVQGRYKAADLMTRKEAAEYFAQDQLYLIDETTASVRFIVPCENGSSNFDDDFDSINQVAEISDTELEREVSEIRTLFFQFFVEAVVATIHGEEEIWLLETGHVRKLYRCAVSESKQKKSTNSDYPGYSDVATNKNTTYQLRNWRSDSKLLNFCNRTATSAPLFLTQNVEAARAINCHGDKRGAVSELVIRNY